MIYTNISVNASRVMLPFSHPRHRKSTAVPADV